MASLFQVALHALAVEPNGLEHPGSGRTGRGEQCFNKLARLFRLEANDVSAGDQPLRFSFCRSDWHADNVRRRSTQRED